MASYALFFVTTFFGFTVALLSHVVEFVLKLCYGENAVETRLKRQLTEFQSELLGINVVDEFAKYAKVQRKMSRVKDQLTYQQRMKVTAFMKMKFTATAFLYILNGLAIAYLLWYESDMPLLEIPPKWLYPLNSLFLQESEGSIGLSMTFWLIVSNRVARILSRNFKLVQKTL